MQKRMKAVVTGTGEVKVVEESLRALKDGEILIRVVSSLVSPGTEMGMVKARREKPDKKAEDCAFGYANAGEILKIKGDSKGLKPGMRVAAMGAGFALHSNYAIVPVNMVIPIPDSVSFEQASYACLGATALQAVRRTIPQLGEFGLVAGLGIVGNLSAQLSSLCGTRVLCWETLDFRVKTAKKCGLKNFANPKEDSCADKTKLFAEPYGYDFGIIAFGGNGTTAFKSMQKQLKVSADGHEMGRIILVGGCEVTLTGGAALGNVDVRAASRTGPGYHDAAWELGADYPKAFVQFTTRRNLIEIITLIDEKRLIVEPMTTHRIKLEDIGKASDALINTPDKALGVSVQMSH